jgi:hypothetical protein
VEVDFPFGPYIVERYNIRVPLAADAEIANFCPGKEIIDFIFICTLYIIMSHWYH